MMRHMKRTGVGLAALFALATACDDSTVGPGAEDLADVDAELIALDQADLLDGILDGEINARPSLIGTGEVDGIALRGAGCCHPCHRRGYGGGYVHAPRSSRRRDMAATS